MVAGHTKFNPDRMFSWLTGILRDLDVFEVGDIVAAVDRARHAFQSQNGRELPYSVMSLDSFNQNGESEFFYNWNEYFEGSFRKFGYLNEGHVFNLHLELGEVTLNVKEFCDFEPTPTSFVNNVQLPKSIQRLKKVPLKEAKVKDLRKMLKYIPGNSLSYVGP
jgi:hypothetical protein